MEELAELGERGDALGLGAMGQGVGPFLTGRPPQGPGGNGTRCSPDGVNG